MKRPTRLRATSAALAMSGSLLLLAGCASSGTSAETTGDGSAMLVTEAGIIGAQADSGEPTRGGTLSYAGYAMPSSLDPTKTQATGPTGGTEMASIYSLLVRYDDAAKAYVPELAESLEESADRLTWTLRLRDGVTFSDGTTVDAAAVVASIDRYNAARGANSQQFLRGVSSVTATDPGTVTFGLVHPWKEFPALLTFGHGMVVAPAGYADPAEFKAIGAGPFTVGSFSPGNSLTVVPRADYWDGAPYLDAIKFVDIAGDQPKLEALKTGGVQMGFLRAGEQVTAAKSEFGGYMYPSSLADVLQINNREGRPGSDVHVRKAIAHTIDEDLFMSRAKQGFGSAGKEIFQPWSQWSGSAEGLPTDTALAAAELQQAKDAGFDGRLVYLSLNNPVSQDIALTIQAMLNAVGFSVEIEFAATTTDLIKRMYADHDFDLAYGANGTPESMPVLRLDDALDSKSKGNILGYQSETMDQLLATARQADTDDDVRKALAEVQNQVNEDAPFVPLGAGSGFVAWTDNVNGAVASPDGIVLLGNASVK